MIPKIIWQTYKTEYKDLPNKALINSKKWKDLHPSYEYRYMSDSDIYDFVDKYYGKEMLRLIKSFKIPVMMADLWRVLVIYEFGGIYADIDTYPTEPLENKIDFSKNMVIGIENGLHYSQWAFMAEPKSPIIKSIIDVIVERCKNIDYNKKEFVHYHTANDAFSEGIRRYFNLPSLNHECADMATKKNCYHNLLHKEALTYSSNKKIEESGFFCFSGEDWDMFREKLIKHEFGSYYWIGENYQSWLDNDLVKKSRDGNFLLYFCENILYNNNDNVEKVTRSLAKALQNMEVPIVPVGFDNQLNKLYVIPREKLQIIEKFNGPLHDKWFDIIDIRYNIDYYLNNSSSVLIPELFNTNYSASKVLEKFNKIKKYIIFYGTDLETLNLSENKIYYDVYIKDISESEGIISIDHNATKDYLSVIKNKKNNIKEIYCPNKFNTDNKVFFEKNNNLKQKWIDNMWQDYANNILNFIGYNK